MRRYGALLLVQRSPSDQGSGSLQRTSRSLALAALFVFTSASERPASSNDLSCPARGRRGTQLQHVEPRAQVSTSVQRVTLTPKWALKLCTLIVCPTQPLQSVISLGGLSEADWSGIRISELEPRRERGISITDRRPTRTHSACRRNGQVSALCESDAVIVM